MNVDIPSWAVRGSKIICIERTGWAEVRKFTDDPYGQMTWPEFAGIYTIREVRIRFVTEYGEVLIGVLLEEVENPVAGGGSSTGEEPGFDIRGFAPIVLERRRAEAEVLEPA